MRYVKCNKIITDAIEADMAADGIPKTYGKARAGENLGEVLGKAFGLDPRVFTDKSWNIKQGDKKGLSNLKIYNGSARNQKLISKIFLSLSDEKKHSIAYVVISKY